MESFCEDKVISRIGCVLRKNLIHLNSSMEINFSFLAEDNQFDIEHFTFKPVEFDIDVRAIDDR